MSHSHIQNEKAFKTTTKVGLKAFCRFKQRGNLIINNGKFSRKVLKGIRLSTCDSADSS
jgi:hypothetical protein